MDGAGLPAAGGEQPAARTAGQGGLARAVSGIDGFNGKGSQGALDSLRGPPDRPAVLKGQGGIGAAGCPPGCAGWP
ncbi:hypothetical protein NY78_0881 [Desulfovibrio sp. TomC]|nr:hypothetical protein NY78_0881 [Desulfovibrio sp. TomC]